MKELREKLEVDVTPPPGVEKNKYFNALMDGANALINGTVVAYRSTTGRNTTPDAIAATVLYGTSFASKILSGTGHFLSTVGDVGKLFGNGASWNAKASTMFAADTLKMASSALGALIGLSWIGLDIFWTTGAKEAIPTRSNPRCIRSRPSPTALSVSARSSARCPRGFNTVFPNLPALCPSRGRSALSWGGRLHSNAIWLAITAYADIKDPVNSTS
ncbi:hypothetical protein ACOJBO_02525 [Rhizobium beringeri]